MLVKIKGWMVYEKCEGFDWHCGTVFIGDEWVSAKLMATRYVNSHYTDPKKKSLREFIHLEFRIRPCEVRRNMTKSEVKFFKDVENHRYSWAEQRRKKAREAIVTQPKKR